MERPKPYEFDAFLSHASEDKPYVRELASRMRDRGWRVWLDEDDLHVGRSLYQQLNAGLATSRFGIVVLSRNYLGKYWTKQELGGLQALASQGGTRVIPMWLEIDSNYVKNLAPMLADTVAIVSAEDPEADAARLSEVFYEILEVEGPLAQMIMADARVGLPWVGEPGFYRSSLALVDEYFVEFLQGRSGPPLPFMSDVPAVSLADLVESTPMFDGRAVGVIGSQVRQQLLYARPFPDGKELRSYVVQLHTIADGYRSALFYARLNELGPAGAPIDIPRPPPEHLALVIGTPILRSGVVGEDGLPHICVYIVAARVFYPPKARAQP